MLKVRSAGLATHGTHARVACVVGRRPGRIQLGTALGWDHEGHRVRLDRRPLCVLRWSDRTGVSGLNTDVDTYSTTCRHTQVAFQVLVTMATSPTVGTLQFRRVQRISDTTATIMRASSFLQLNRTA